MPATIVHEPLGVHFTFVDGTDWTVRLAGLPNPQLARDLAVGLAANAHPHGGIKRRATANGYGIAARRMVHALSKDGFSGPASELTRGVLMRFWMASNHTRERNTRQLLKDLDLATGCLRPDVRAYLDGEPVQARPVLSTYKAYTEAEWERLETTCRKAVDESYARYKLAVQSGKWGSDPLLTDRKDAEEDFAWLMLRRGPLTYNAYLDYFRARTGEKRGMRKTFSTTGCSAAQQVRDDLFPSRPIMAAYKALLGVYCGVVPDGIADLGVGDVEWAGDARILLSYVKGRTTRESSVLTGPAVRLLEQWLDHSSTLRRFAADDLKEELWIGVTEHKADAARDHVKGAHRRKFVALSGLVDDQGRTFSIHGGRIRHTYDERLARRGWTGRALIDPNHSARTEGDHYATPTDPDQLDDIDSIINDGQADILRKALPPVVLTSERAAQFAADFPDEVRRLGLDTAAIAELVGGERDVFTAACTNQLAGVHGPAGKPCPARPWVCLLCPLAVFLPRHASNLLRLNAFFARQFQQMTTDHYLRVFGPYAHRLTHDILPKFAPEAEAKGALDLADDDSEIPLRPEEATR
ncbi:Integrase OS=Streptomyces microflavus OX=1919 GN=Smic_07840 PE=4 SV=1 [Streptomyces microflavus]